MLHIDWVSLFHNVPPELATVLVAMLPIAELRAAIPVAIVGFDLPWWSAYFWSVVGNLIPAVLLLLFLEPVAQWLMRVSRFFDRFFTWLFNRTRRKFSSSAAQYGTFVALTLFVAIPLPVTGAWTGAAAAFVFGIAFRRALPALVLGVVIAGAIVTLTTVGAQSLF
ncbi:MAG: COG2426 family protein [Patescibacteria group bacterium]